MKLTKSIIYNLNWEDHNVLLKKVIRNKKKWVRRYIRELTSCGYSRFKKKGGVNNGV